MDSERYVYIIDDDDAVRRSVKFVLSWAGYHVETFESGIAFLKVVDDLRPGCVLLDVRMPVLDGFGVHQMLKRRGAMMPVIILTGHGDVQTAVQAMRAGALNFLIKPYAKEALLEAVAEAVAIVARSGRDGVTIDEAKTKLNALTSRELDVLRGMVSGLPNKVIARGLGISPRTVEIHRANVMEKTASRSLADVLRIAMKAGIEGRGQERPA